ncbi:MAG: translocation/assembly module TamB [Prevotellaceae bacterium]|jgi:hypothetical protein|nr:translocation/assembly module TamB [Prevotellaceae bacterium]
MTKTTDKQKKTVKRGIRIALVVLLILIALPPVIISIPVVQTAVVKRISAKLSAMLQTEIEVQSVNIRFFNTVQLNGVMVRDFGNDTLLYVKKLEANVRKLPLSDNLLVLNKIKLSDGFFCLKSDSTGTNINAIVKKINQENNSNIDLAPELGNAVDTVSAPMKVSVKALELSNFRYKMQLDGFAEIEEQPEGIIYKNMLATNINLDADRISILHDTLNFRVNSLSFSERSGFNVRRMSADTGFIRFGQEVTLREFRMVDDFSDVKMKNLSMLYNGGDEFNDFIENVNFVLDIYDSQISFQTIGFFAPELSHIPITAKLKAKINGPVSNFRSDDFEIEALDKTVINGRFSIAGLPEIESTMLFADTKYFQTCPKDILKILSDIKVGFDDENLLYKFGNMNFTGTFTGFFNNFVSNGYLWSNLGDLKLDLQLNSSRQGTGFKGSLAAMDFDIGSLTDAAGVGKINFNVIVDGSINSGQNDFFGKGIVSSLNFNGYNYKNINLEGRLTNQAFNGKVGVAEPDIDFDFDGSIDLAGDDGIPDFDFKADLRHVDLVRLKFNTRDSVSILKTQVDANFSASSIFNHVGELHLKNCSYRDDKGLIELGAIDLNSLNKNNKNSFSLQSDFLNASYSGQHDMGAFINQIVKNGKQVLPNLFDEIAGLKKYSSEKPNYSFSAQIKNMNEAARIFLPELSIDSADIQIAIDTASRLKIKFDAKQIKYGDEHVAGLEFTGNGDANKINIDFTGNFNLFGINLPNLKVDNILSNNQIKTALSFNNSEFHSSADVNFSTGFVKNSESNKLTAVFEIERSQLTVFAKEWNIEPTIAKISSDQLSINEFNINRQGQEVKISGKVSSRETDTLMVMVNNLNLGGINPYIADGGYSIYGNLSGEVELRGLYGIPLVNGNISVDTLTINRDTLGGFVIGSMWDDDLRRLNFAAHIYGHTINKMDGYLVPTTGEISAKLEIPRLQLKPIEPLLSGILSNIDGTASGEVQFSGTVQNPKLTGRMKLNEVSVTVDYLKTQYVINSDIDISDSRFYILNGKITDKSSGNTGTLNLDLTHRYFSDIKFSASANVNNFLSLNTGERDNPLFYGRAYGTGVVSLTGNSRQFEFQITAETDSHTKLYIPIPSISQAKDYDFLTFTNTSDSVSAASSAILSDESNISLGLDLSVTPESEIQILIDPKVNDILRARGQGNLNIKIDPSTDLFNIIGDYSIESGDYNFTVPNFSIISRKFLIDKGSTIHFNGNIEQALLDVKASYKERVSIAPLFPQDSMRHYPVACQIMITGQMSNPVLKFNVEIQDIGPEKNAQFKSIINTDEKMAQQFLSILLLKSFMPEQNFANQDLGSTTLMSNASEFISAQMGNLISMFNLPVPIDFRFDYNANSQYNSSGDFEFDVGIQLSDRIILNGRAGNATHSNRNFVGDFDLELMLGKYGNTRFKVFSKSKDYFSDDMESNRNGIGILYQSQFDRFKDIFRRKKSF